MFKIIHKGEKQNHTDSEGQGEKFLNLVSMPRTLVGKLSVSPFGSEQSSVGVTQRLELLSSHSSSSWPLLEFEDILSSASSPSSFFPSDPQEASDDSASVAYSPCSWASPSCRTPADGHYTSVLMILGHTLDPMIQIHLVLFPQLIILPLALWDVLPVSANLHHVLPQGQVLQFPTWPQIWWNFWYSFMGGFSGSSWNVISKKKKNSFLGRSSLLFPFP